MICDLTSPYMRRRHTFAGERRLVLAVALAIALLVLLGGLVQAGLSAPGTGRITVAPGDTLWSIAADHSAGGDVRAEVDSIMRVNNLSGPVLVPGESLVVPAG